MKNNKKIFYTISLSRGLCGIISIVTSVMNHVLYALENGYIPVVDLKHYDNMYFKSGRRYRDNAWEYFFKQPFGFNLNDIDKNADYDVLISKNTHETGSKYDFWISQSPIDNNHIDKRIEEIKKYYKKYLKFSDNMNEYIKNNYQKFLLENSLNEDKMSKKVLGVLLRGTDYTERKSPGEHIQPDFEEIKRRIREIMKKYPDIEKIYAATEDKNVYQMFKNEFGHILIENHQYMYEQTEREKKLLLGEINVSRENHHFKLAEEYILSLYILSKCGYFTAGRCNGSAFAWLLSDGFKYLYIYRLGNYPSFEAKPFYNNTFEKIFSIKDDKNKTHKILTFAGIKIKIKTAGGKTL